MKPRETKVLAIIIGFWAKHNRPPTLDEVAKVYGCWKKNIWESCDVLRIQGYLQHGPKHTTGNLIPTPQGKKALKETLGEQNTSFDGHGVLVTDDGIEIFERVLGAP